MPREKVQYPRKAYTLTSGYNVRAVILVRPYSETSNYGGYTKKGNFYSESDLFDTPKAAIKSGRSKVARIRKNLALAAESLEKYTAALDKAEGK